MSGIYRVQHSQHKLPAEVGLLKGQEFPRCSKCQNPVVFKLVRAAPEPEFRVALYELPELSAEEEEQDGKKLG